MKTTLDLPADLVMELKLRAVHEDKKLKDLVAETLRAGLATIESNTSRPARVTTRKDRRTGVVVIRCPADAPARKMTVRQLARLESDTLMRDDLERAGIPVRH